MTIIGLLFLAAPFILIGILCLKEGGLKCFIFVFGGCLAIVTPIFVGVKILESAGVLQ